MSWCCGYYGLPWDQTKGTLWCKVFHRRCAEKSALSVFTPEVSMNTRGAFNSLLRRLIVSMVIAGVPTAFAADEPPTSPPVPSKAMREQMATLHEEMAACLRSDKTLAACREEMQKSCRGMMGEQGCPMRVMGMGMHDQMMKPGPAVTPDSG